MDEEQLCDEIDDLMFRFRHVPPRHEERLTAGEYAIVYFLDRSPKGIYSGELAELIHVGTGRIGNALKNLEKKGLVIRKTDPNDRRKVRVFLTEEGKKRANALHQRLRARQKRLIEAFGEERMSQYIQESNALLDTWKELVTEEEN